MQEMGIIMLCNIKGAEGVLLDCLTILSKALFIKDKAKQLNFAILKVQYVLLILTASYRYSSAVNILSASLGEPEMRNTLKIFSSMADIRTFFSLACLEFALTEDSVLCIFVKT